MAKEIRDAGGTCEPFSADLTDPISRNLVVKATVEKFGGIDGLVNVAGVAAHGPFESGLETLNRQLMEINFFATTEMSRLCTPPLIESAAKHRQPVIMNVGSVVSRFGFPGVTDHAASKHALIGFIESVRVEFVRFGIDVLFAAPGIVKTDETAKHLLRDEFLIPVDFTKGNDPEYVAERIIQAMERNKTESYIGRDAWWVNIGRRIGPRILRKMIWRKYGIGA